MEFTTVFIVTLILVSASGAPNLDQAPTNAVNSVESYFANHRIVGGENAPEASAPWSAAISTGSTFRFLICGGSLISIRHVLTAAHCIASLYGINGLTTGLLIHVGSNRWDNRETRYNIIDNITHHDYQWDIIKNDIGCLITENDVILGPRVAVLGLSFKEIGGGEDVMVAGWGRLASGGDLPDTLQRIFLKTIDGDECIKRVAEFDVNSFPPPVYTHVHICTLTIEGEGTCNGDSGSALISVKSQEQVGIVSWGFACARGAPDVYARISGFRDFLNFLH